MRNAVAKDLRRIANKIGGKRAVYRRIKRYYMTLNPQQKKELREQ